MDKSRWIKIIGFAGSLCTGAALIVSGSVVEGAGIIAASLSSITFVKPSASS